MPTVAPQPERFVGQVVGNGHCVAHVREATGLPHTSRWRRGALVRGSSPASGTGTAIATFDPDGTYGNHTDGRSHACLLISEHVGFLVVSDQWVGRPVHDRIVHFRNGTGDPVNDGDAYYTIELADSA